MGYFLLAALGSAIYFWLVLAIQPSGFIKFVLGRLLGVAPRTNAVRLLRLQIAILALGLPFGLFLIVTGLVHPATSLLGGVATIVFSPTFRNALLGVAFGAIFVVWLGRLYMTTGNQPISKGLVFEGYFLLTLFLLGSLDILDPILSRVSGLKVPGAEISLSAGKTVNAPSLAAVTGKSGHGQQPIPLGLTLLSDLDGMIDRDNVYIGLMSARQASDGNATALSVPSTDFRTFFRQSFAPLAQCQAAIFNVTRSREFVRTSLDPVIGHLHGLMSALRYGNSGADLDRGVETNLAQSLATASSASIGRAYLDEVANYEAVAVPNKEPPEPVKVLSNGCAALLKLACTVQSRDYCNPSKAPGRTILPGRFSAPVIDELRQDFEAVFHKDLTTLVSDPQAGQRPYLAIAAALVASTLGEPDAALLDLDRWTSADDRSKAAIWYRLRVLTTASSVAEEWLRSGSVAAANPAVRDYQFDLLEKVVAGLENLDFVATTIDAFKQKATDRPTLAFDIHPVDTASCRVAAARSDVDLQDRARLSANLVVVYISSMQTYLDRAMDLPDVIGNPRLRIIETMLMRLNVVDFGCLSLLYPDETERNDQIAGYRADFLRLNARRLLMSLDGQRKVLDADTVSKSLATAEEAVDAGLAIIKPSRDRDITAQTQATEFLDKIAPSNAQETYDELQFLKSIIRARLE